MSRIRDWFVSCRSQSANRRIQSASHTDQGYFKFHSRGLSGFSATRRRYAGGSSCKRDVNVIYTEYGQLPRGVPIDGNVCAEFIAMLLIGSAVRDHRVSTRNITILENNDARALSQRRSEPRRVFSIYKHRTRVMKSPTLWGQREQRYSFPVYLSSLLRDSYCFSLWLEPTRRPPGICPFSGANRFAERRRTWFPKLASTAVPSRCTASKGKARRFLGRSLNL